MEVNELIEDFDKYVKDNRKFMYFNEGMKKFTTIDFPLAEEIGILSTCFIEHKSNRECTDLSKDKKCYDVESFDKKRVKI